ncbi:30S ribosomal protein S16 [Blattabacterium cuenoti]|nr:30S ribosomal protein S16 [Blattabacterium cuenoti]
MVRIRLKRIGKKHRPIYHIIVADSRSPRDGRFIEKLGIYNPNSNPSIITLNIDNSISWMIKGAKPTNTVNSIFKKNGVLLKKHLLNGVKKGALTKEECYKKFNEWNVKNKN